MLTDKINEGFNFKNHGTYDVQAIKKIVDSLSDEEWSMDVSRQNSYRLLRDTESYFIYQSNSEWSFKTPFSSNFVCPNLELAQYVEPIIQDLENIHLGKRAKVLLTRLKPGKSIAKHQDSGHYLFAVRRHHLAINTDEDITFTVGKETINMMVGDCWEINNSLAHGVINNGNTTRVHLIVDIMPDHISNLENSHV